MKFSIALITAFISCAFAASPTPEVPEGRIISPYEACKNVFIVDKKKYSQHTEAWNSFAKTCNADLQFAEDVSITSIDPLAEGAKYLMVAQKVTQKVLENTEKSRKYAACSSLCFSAAVSCGSELDENNKVVNCADRKKEVLNFLKVTARKIKMELALSNASTGSNQLNVQNVMSAKPDQFINEKLQDIDMLTPNPLGNVSLTEREMKEAKRRAALDRKKIDEEYKTKKIEYYNTWMPARLMKNLDDHAEAYRGLIYEEAPIFSVIGKPSQVDTAGEPVWTDKQIAHAFQTLVQNTKNVKEKVNYSLKESKLEFNRWTTDALLKAAISMAPGTTERNDLLFYMGMSKQVEEVLKENPNLCGSATEMIARVQSKDMQNTGALVAFTAGSVIASKVGSGVFRIGKALTAAQASGITGLALGSVSLGNSMNKYNNMIEEAATISGIGSDKEGTGLRTAEEVIAAKNEAALNLAFIAGGSFSGWAGAKILYGHLGKKMKDELLGMSNAADKVKINSASRDAIVDAWMSNKIKNAQRAGIFSEADTAALTAKNSHKKMEDLVAKIEKSNPDFFKDPKNFNFFLKAATNNLRKHPDDPINLGEKAESLINKLNASAIKGNMSPRAEKGLLKVYDDAIEELRIANRKDPATYAKFGTDPASDAIILNNALKRAGVSSADDVRAMRQCILKK